MLTLRKGCCILELISIRDSSLRKVRKPSKNRKAGDVDRRTLGIVFREIQKATNVRRAEFIEQSWRDRTCVADRMVLHKNLLACSPLLSEPQIAGNIGFIPMVQLEAIAEVISIREPMIDPAGPVPEICGPRDRDQDASDLNAVAVHGYVPDFVEAGDLAINVWEKVQSLQHCLPALCCLQRAKRNRLKRRIARRCR